MQIKSTWYQTNSKTIEDIASALAFNSWRITKNHLEDLINEAFVIEKAQVFDIIAEYLCFLIQCIDRLIFDNLSAENRQKLIILIAKQLANYYQENKQERIGSGNHQQEFIQLYNQRLQDYSNYSFIDGKPDYHFLCYFGEKIQQAMTKIDEKWIKQQMVEIQAPKAFDSINKSLKKIIAVEKITSKDKATQDKKTKIPRSKRKSTRLDS